MKVHLYRKDAKQIAQDILDGKRSAYTSDLEVIDALLDMAHNITFVRQTAGPGAELVEIPWLQAVRLREIGQDIR